MKTMICKKTGQKVKIVEHIITRNFWEYYVTDQQFNKDIKTCIVMGHEIEMGDVYMPEITPYILSKTEKLEGVAPCAGWNWE